MNSALKLLLIEALIKYGPALARDIAAIFYVAEPTLDDWNKLFDKAEKTYEAYVAGLPKP